MADEKGNIVLKPVLDVRKAITAVKELAGSISDMFKKSSNNKETQFKALQEQIENSQSKLRSLNSELKNTEKELRKAEAAATKAHEEFTEFAQTDKGIKELQAELDEIPKKLERFKQRQDDIASGKIPISRDYEKLDEALEEANKELAEFIAKREQATSAIVAKGNEYNAIKSVPAHSAGSKLADDKLYYTREDAERVNKLLSDIRLLRIDLLNAGEAAELVRQNIEQINVRRQKLESDPTTSSEYYSAGERITDLEIREQELIREIKNRETAYRNTMNTLNSTATTAENQMDSLRARGETLRGEIVNTKTEIESTKDKVKDLKKELNGEETGGKGGGLFSRMFNSMRQLDHMFKRMTTRLLFYNTFGKTIRAFTEYLGRAVQADSNLVYSLGALKAAFATTFQYIWSVIGPIISKIIAIILNLVNAINRLLSLITGKSLKDMQNGAKALDGYGKAAKGATKEIKKTLAAFDELIQIGDKDEDAGSGGAGGGEGIPLNWDDSLLKGKLSELDIYVAGAMLAVGAILTFTGANIPLGLGLMAAGAAVLVSALMEDWDTMPREIKRALTRVLIILGGAALVIGAILAFSGHPALGIGLMIAGAAALGTAAQLNWDTIEKKIKGPVNVVMAIISAAVLAIGALLAFSGANVPLGIGLIIAGAVGLAAAATINWDTIEQSLRGPFGKVLAIISSALIVIGVLLVFTGANLLLGLGLIIVGAAGLAKVVSVNWDTIKTKLQGPFGEIMALIGVYLIVLGVILIMSGAGIPLGLGILAIGALSLAAPIAANWDIIREKIKGAWESIKQYWEQHIKPIFTIKWWSDKFSSIKDGLRESLNAAIAVTEKALNDIGKKISEVLSFDVPSIIPGIGGKHFGITIPTVRIPRLAEGGVIPPNKEFMAMLGDQKHGTNIETPLETMIQAFNAALDGRDNSQNININFTGSLAEVARLLKPQIDNETTRQGKRSSNGLIVGGNY